MAFNPRSDVVQEVMNAADPSRASLAAERLASLGQGAPPAGDFAADLARVSTSAIASPTDLATAQTPDARVPDKAAKAKVEFEAMLMNSFMSELLPKDAETVFGKGAAGDMWRSMLSEQVARQIAKSGALSLTRHLFATHDLPGAMTAHETRIDIAAQMSPNVLSKSQSADVTDGSVLFAGAQRI